MKYILRFTILVFLLCPLGVSAQESTMVNEQRKELGFSAMERAVRQSEGLEEISPSFDFNALVESLTSGENIFSPKTILGSVLRVFSKEVYENLHIMLTLIVLSIICAVAANLQSSFQSKSVAEVAFFACYILFVGILVRGFYTCVTLARGVISDQVVFLKAAVPTYVGLLMSCGSVTTAVTLEPLFLWFVQLIGSLIESILLPFLFWISILSMINNLSDKFHISNLIRFSRQLITWLLGILLTFFVGILSLAGIGTSAADGVGVKAMKYAVGNFIPVVGGLLSESVDTVMSSTVILKNSVGVAGVVVLILICAVPALELLALIGMYKLTASVIEPLSDKRIVELMNSAASAVTYLFLMVVSVTLMFILSVAVVIGFGNLTHMIS